MRSDCPRLKNSSNTKRDNDFLSAFLTVSPMNLEDFKYSFILIIKKVEGLINSLKITDFLFPHAF